MRRMTVAGGPPVRAWRRTKPSAPWLERADQVGRALPAAREVAALAADAQARPGRGAGTGVQRPHGQGEAVQDLDETGLDGDRPLRQWQRQRCHGARSGYRSGDPAVTVVTSAGDGPAGPSMRMTRAR